MKYIIIVLLLSIGLGCSKDKGDYCWTCEVQRMDGTKYTDKKCSDEQTPLPEYKDANGNQLQVGCTKNW